MTEGSRTAAPVMAIVGDSSSIASLREQIGHLAAFDTVGNPHVPTTLVVGETGTGKGLVARVIHDCGPRSRGPFVDVNCAAIPENLLEAELFGFEAGAFTDAKRAKPGLFEAAAQGTLFLDEIDSLSLSLQAKFLKAIEEKRVRRLGAVAARAVDVKIIAATQRDLAVRVQEGRFRPDLYHRLTSVVLSLPPLRERGDDVLLLAEQYLAQYASAHRFGPVELAESGRTWLRKYAWPGNVRELSHLLERAVLLGKGRPINAELLEELRTPGRSLVQAVNTPPEDDHGTDATRIRNALTKTAGNVLRAARILGVSRNVLRYRMRRYGIERPALADEPLSPSIPASKPSRALPTSRSASVVDRLQARPHEPGYSLVGRERELGGLAEALEFAAQGRARAVMATGPGGIGKTRLLRALRAPAERAGFVWFEGCYEKNGSHPYQAWVQIIRQTLHHRDTAETAHRLGSRLPMLARVAPQLGEHSESTSSPADPETERLKMFESFTEFFIQLSRRKPLVLFTDDLQWAPSLDLFHYLLRNIGDEKILLLATCRSDELKLENELWPALMTIRREPLCLTFRLGPLSVEDVEQFLQVKLGGPVAPSLARAIAARSGGNPFFIEEILRLLQEQDALIRNDSGWEGKPTRGLGVPDSVQMVIGERMDRLGETAREILTWAAVIGREFSQRLLQSAVGKDDATVADALDRSEAAGVITPTVALSGDAYHFSHDLIHETLYQSLGAAQRRRYHLEIARALERIDERNSEALAFHYLAGADAQKALHYSLRVGEAAERAFSWARAERHYENAVGLLERHSGDAAAQARLHEKLADLASLLGHANLEHSQRALDIYRALEDWPKACRLERLIGIAWTSGTAGEVNLERALDHFQKSAALAERHPDLVEKSLAKGYLAFGLLRARLDLPRAKDEAEKALVTAARLDDADVQARIHTELGVAHAYLGNVSVAREHAEQSYRLAQRAKDPWIGARAALYPIAFWPWRNDRQWLELWTRRCLEHRRSVLVTRYDLPNFSLRALLLAFTGRPAEASEMLRHAEESLVRRAFFTPYWLHFTAAATAIVGSERRAIDLFEESLRASRAGHLLSSIAEVVLFARFLIGRGDMVRAEEILREADGIATEHDSPAQRLNVLPLLAEVNVSKGDLGEAEAFLARADDLQKRFGAGPGFTAPLRAALGLLATARGDWRMAEQHFCAALESERQHGFLYNEAGILLKTAELDQRRGADGSSKARELRTQALEIFERCGAATDAERTRRLL